VYRIVPDDDVLDQVAELPEPALVAFRELLDVWPSSPGTDSPSTPTNPTPRSAGSASAPAPATPARRAYLILEDRGEVHVLLVQWLC
jgi:hypothetical protein